MRSFWLCFFPMFVAVDAVGVLPLFLHLTAGLDHVKTRRVIVQSVATATVVALVFLIIGRYILEFLGVTVADFMVAGGALLFVLSLTDLIFEKRSIFQGNHEALGAVPLGVPLIVGPAVITTIFILVGEHGLVPTVAATIVNIAIAGVVFWLAVPLHRVLGSSGTRTISKLASLLLAAIGVMMVRKGIEIIISAHRVQM
ncbi:MAG: MarC family protein [Deltaproteobacteria bacterium]|nr:MarC family protein [Deltaproteobacteria bacterium]